MSIVLLILKIIGIALLVLLGVLLYLVLFPVWLGARGGMEEEPFFRASVRGFLRFWQLDLEIRKDKREVTAAACWGKWQLYPSKKAAASGKRNVSPVSDCKAHTPTEVPVSDNAAESSPDSADAAERKRRLRLAAVRHKGEMPVSAPGKTQADSPGAASMDSHPEKAAERKEDGNTSASKADQKDTLNLAGDALKLIAQPDNRRGLGFILRQLGAVFRKMRFHLGGTDMDFALSDPRYTGYLAGALLQLHAWYEEDVSLRPDFTAEDPYMKGVVCLNAHLSLGMLLYAILRVLLHRDSRNLIRRLMTLYQKAKS